MTHTEESLMALADVYAATEYSKGHADRNTLRLAIREVLAERDQLAILVKLRPAPEVRDDAVLRERAERAEAEVERLRTLLAPLAALDQPHNERIKDDIPLFAINGKAITAGDARAARAAIEQERNK